jgi:uncharacterized protein (UPF0332 family)
MKRPETAAYLAKARQSLKEARVPVANDLPDAAGRAVYLAAYHAAQAFVFDKTSNVAKTHSGVRSEFARLAKVEPCIERSFPTFLARAYSLKENADYAIGHNAGITIDEAKQAIEIAVRFVDGLAQLLEAAPP